MHTLTHKCLSLVAVLALASAVCAQTAGPEARDRAMNSPEFARSRAATKRAGGLLARARQRFRERNLPEAQRLASEALLTMDEVHESYPDAHDLLAQCHLLQGEAGLALAELGGPIPVVPSSSASDGSTTSFSAQGRLTRAIAFARLGQTAAARQVLSRDVEKFHSYAPGWRLPMDSDDSPHAVEATALLFRSGLGGASDVPEAFEDSREAAVLAPGSASAHYFLSKALSYNHKLDEALLESDRSTALANEREAKVFSTQVKALRRAIEKRDAKKSG